MPIRGSGRSVESARKPTAQSTSAGGVGADDHHLVADRLDHARVVGQRLADQLDEALDDLERLLLAHLLGQPRVAGEVGEGDRDAHPAERGVVGDRARGGRRRPARAKCCSSRWWTRVHDRPGQRQQLGREVGELLGDVEHRRAVADHRLVDEEVEELDLGVGDLRERLPVDAHELQEGDQRQPGVEHRGEALQQREVVVGEVLQRRGREPGGGPDAADQLRLEAGLARPRRRGRARRLGAPGTGPRGTRRRAGPPWPRRAAGRGSGRAARSRATIRAWASAAGVHSPSRSGTIPSATQRRSVAGETESARATSVSVSSSAMLAADATRAPAPQTFRCGFSRST